MKFKAKTLQYHCTWKNAVVTTIDLCASTMPTKARGGLSAEHKGTQEKVAKRLRRTGTAAAAVATFLCCKKTKAPGVLAR